MKYPLQQAITVLLLGGTLASAIVGLAQDAGDTKRIENRAQLVTDKQAITAARKALGLETNDFTYVFPVERGNDSCFVSVNRVIGFSPQGLPKWADAPEYLIVLRGEKVYKFRLAQVEGGPANGSQPIRSETNQTSSAAGPRR
jgi:hypothetical protein